MKRYGINNKRELMAAIACYWLVAVAFWMVVRPEQFTQTIWRLIP